MEMERTRGAGVLAQFVRFVVVGGSSNIVYALVFLLLCSWDAFAANVAGALINTVLANELHRRLTFQASARVHWFHAQWEGGGLAILGLLLSTISLALLDLWLPSASGLPQAILMVAVSAFVGVLRFLALRGWVFSEPAPTDRLRLHHAGWPGHPSGPPTSAMPTSR
jgi:putative flippase GtrA